MELEDDAKTSTPLETKNSIRSWTPTTREARKKTPLSSKISLYRLGNTKNEIKQRKNFTV